MDAFFVFWIFIALLVGWSGYNRTIGFWGAFFLSIILGPIGWLVVIFSRRVYLTQGYSGQTPVMVQQASKYISEIPNQIEKAESNELDTLKKERLSKILDEWESGIITEEQYRIKKEKIMLL